MLEGCSRLSKLQGVELEERHHWWKSGGSGELRELLMEHWDPIGVNGTPEARDEYDGYLGPLANMLHAGADAQAVAEYLANIQTERMDSPVRDDQLHDVAIRVVAWYSSEMQH